MIVRVPVIRVPSDRAEGAEFIFIGTRQHEDFNADEIAKAIVHIYGKHASIPLLRALIREFNALGDAMDAGHEVAIEHLYSVESYSRPFEVKSDDC